MREKQRFIDSPAAKKKISGAKVFGSAVVLCAVVIIVFSKAGLLNIGRNSVDLTVLLEKTNGMPPEKPFLPDISGVTVDAVEKMMPVPRAGKILFDRIDIYPEYRKFMEGEAPRHLRLTQRRINPRALVVASGDYTWSMLYEEVHAIDPESKIIKKEGFVYTLSSPLLVLDGASLSISGKEVSELRLSKQANAYLVTAGDLYVVRTRVIGWNEEKNEPTSYNGEKRDYRPFLTCWDGGNMYLAGSYFVSLGYLGGKAYGISYSGCTPCEKFSPGKPAATGIIVGSTFTDLYYGFYSYEAEDVKIVGNTYFENVIYAIDPHDRSRRLIIANNETYNTHKKHGIIVSREVNDSWIFGNHSHNNHGSGIMIDRTSINNTIADNLSENNNQDGLTFFESENNVTWGNTFRYNKKNGVRIRNSWDIKLNNDTVEDNAGTSIEVYTADISGQKTRDFEMDPYTAKASAIVNGASISTSGAAVFKIKDAELLGITNTQVRAATHLFPLSSQYDEKAMRENISKSDIMVKVISPYFPDAQPPLAHKPFVEE